MRNPRTPRRRSRTARRTTSPRDRPTRAILIETERRAPSPTFKWLRAVRAKLRIGKRHAHGR